MALNEPAVLYDPASPSADRWPTRVSPVTLEEAKAGTKGMIRFNLFFLSSGYKLKYGGSTNCWMFVCIDECMDVCMNLGVCLCVCNYLYVCM